MWQIEKHRRDGLIYDVTIKQFDTSFWKQLSGTTTVSSNKLRNNAASIASYLLFEFPDIEFAMTVPAVPTSGDSRIFGLFAPSPAKWSAAYFQITDTTFKAVVMGPNGDTVNKTLTWSAGYTAVSTRFRILVEPDEVIFSIEGVVVATFKETINMPMDPAPIYILNGNADNMDCAYVGVRRAAGMV